ncbi:MAG TPA: helix-hairpin-helix domain-containing protein [bacterium]|nr:helix-hairpin-helix domain-containing protein [bacterium]
MKCPICEANTKLTDRFCPACGAFLRGKRSGCDESKDLRVDINNDSLERIERLPGISRERAVALVRERMNRSGFMNLSEVMSFLNLDSTEKIEFGKSAVCLPVGVEIPSECEKTAAPSQADEWSEMTKREEARKKSSKTSRKEERPTPVSARKKVDINSASESEIAALPALNAIIAKNIVSEREARGGFLSIDELAQAVGLKQFMIELISPMVEFKPMVSNKSGRKLKGRVVDY